MTAHKVGYARVSTQDQDLTAQTEGLIDLGVTQDLIFTDHGLTGTNRQRPGLEKALAAVVQEAYVQGISTRTISGLRDLVTTGP